MIQLLHKRLPLALLLLLGAVMCSCQNASFNPPDIPSPWFFTMQTHDIKDGDVNPDKMGGPPHISPNAHIVVGWEIPNSSLGQALYIFGDTTIMSMGFGRYKYSLHIGDSLPKFVVRTSALDTIAIAHVFVTEDPLLRNGDTIIYSHCWTNSEIIGSLDGEAIIFRRGHPIVAGGISLDNFNSGPSGYTVVHGDCTNGNTYNSVKPEFNPNPDIFMDDRTDEIKFRNPFWLQ